MSWSSDSNNKYNNLLEMAEEVTKINTFSFGCFIYRFYNLKNIDKTSLCMKLNNLTGFKHQDFIEWMQVRKIRYLLGYRYIKKMSLKLNCKTFIYGYIPLQVNAIVYNLKLIFSLLKER